jgi:uncharacterized MAPEG superfamily protein
MDYPLVLLSLAMLAYVPHLFLRGPAVHAILSKRGKGMKTYDIRTPRIAQSLAAEDATDEGRYVARLNGHHANSLETFPFIAAAIFACVLRAVPAQQVNFLATSYLITRVIYTPLYIYGTTRLMGIARALVWAAGFGVVCYMLFLASKSS